MIKRYINIFLFLCMAGAGYPQQYVWEAAQPMPQPRFGASVVVDNYRIWLIGGFDEDGNPVNTVDTYYPDSDVWESSGKHLQIPRGNAAAVMYKDTLYVIGGQDSMGHAIASVEKFNPYMRGWEIHSKLSLPRYSHSAVVYDDKIIVIGGETGEIDHVADIEYWEPAEKIWKTYESWKTAKKRTSMAAVVANNAIYTFGGITVDLGPISGVERFSIGGVDELTSMPIARFDFAAVAVNDTIYIIGGKTPEGTIAGEILKYSTERDSWDAADNNLNVGRFGLSAVLHGSYIYIFGGQQYNALEGSMRATNQVYRLQVLEQSTSVPSHEYAASNAFRLLQNYPNPFNATTTITFHLAEPASNVKIDIVNLQGETIFSQHWNLLSAGEKTMMWAGTDSKGQLVASGMFFYRLTIDNKLLEIRKLMLLK